MYTRYSADFIITTSAFRFSVHTGVWLMTRCASATGRPVDVDGLQALAKASHDYRVGTAKVASQN
jgi:hypothetical protein